MNYEWLTYKSVEGKVIRGDTPLTDGDAQLNRLCPSACLYELVTRQNALPKQTTFNEVNFEMDTTISNHVTTPWKMNVEAVHPYS